MEFLNTKVHKKKKVVFTVCNPGKKSMLPMLLSSFFAVSPDAVAVTVAAAVAEADTQTEPDYMII
jgi:hypothetical protein